MPKLIALVVNTMELVISTPIVTKRRVIPATNRKGILRKYNEV